jgi:hypothetical protein
MVHEDVPHRARRDAEEVSAILPANSLLVDKANESLIDEGGGLQRRVSRPAIQIVA